MVVVVVVVVGGVVRTGGAGLNRYLVVVSGAFSKSFEGGPSTCLRSTQHRMVWEGHEISSRTSSQSKEANAWRHFPGHSLTSAVLVMEPSKPDKSPPNPGGGGPCRAGVEISSFASCSMTLVGFGNCLLLSS